jgi:hypothetical protein
MEELDIDLKGKYVFNSHLLEIDKTSFIAYLDLPTDAKVLQVVFDENTKGIFALTQYYTSELVAPNDKLRFSFLFVEANWEVDDGLIDSREYLNTIKPVGVPLFGSFAYHVFVGYESIYDEAQIAMGQMEKELDVVAA